MYRGVAATRRSRSRAADARALDHRLLEDVEPLGLQVIQRRARGHGRRVAFLQISFSTVRLRAVEVLPEPRRQERRDVGRPPRGRVARDADGARRGGRGRASRCVGHLFLSGLGCPVHPSAPRPRRRRRCGKRACGCARVCVRSQTKVDWPACRWRTVGWTDRIDRSDHLQKTPRSAELARGQPRAAPVGVRGRRSFPRVRAWAALEGLLGFGRPRALKNGTRARAGPPGRGPRVDRGAPAKSWPARGASRSETGTETAPLAGPPHAARRACSESWRFGYLPPTWCHRRKKYRRLPIKIRAGSQAILKN